LNNMTAKIIGENQNARMPDKKEEVDRAELVTRHKGKLCSPITARFFMGRSAAASVVYCCVWIRTARGTWHSGRGSAGGCGYHKTSAALDDALASAGVELYGYPYSNPNRDRDGKPIEDLTALKTKRASISGVGESAMRYALEAVAKAAGYRGRVLLVGL
jgi:hypothetical protein